MAQAGKEFWLHGAVKSVVDTLVDDRLHPIVFNADFTDLCNLPGLVVRDCKTGEEAFVVEIVDGFHCSGERGCAVGPCECLVADLGCLHS